MCTRAAMFMIAGMLAGAPGVLAQAGLPLEDRSAFEQAREIGTVEAYDAFLRLFPSGFHADLAKAARRHLAEAADSDAAVGSRWSHNGSVLVLAAKGYSWQLFYEAPRVGIRKAGAEQGTLLLDGQARGGEVSGTAYVFAGRCGAFPYKVAGRMSRDGRRVVLSGQAPRIDPRGCRVSGNLDDELVFERLDEGSERTAGVIR